MLEFTVIETVIMPSFYVKSQAWFKMDRLADRFLPVLFVFVHGH